MTSRSRLAGPDQSGVEETGGRERIGHVTRFSLRNFTVFRDFDQTFSPGLNLIMGENGAGKSHLLKAIYSFAMAVCGPYLNIGDKENYGSYLSIGDEISKTFGDHDLEDFISFGVSEGAIELGFEHSMEAGKSYDFSAQFEGRKINLIPLELVDRDGLSGKPVFFPTGEVISAASKIVGLFEKYSDLGIDRTQFELAKGLLAPALNWSYLPEEFKSIHDGIVSSLGGRPKATGDNRFVMVRSTGEEGTRNYVDRDGLKVVRLEAASAEVDMVLTAEGHRKLAQLLHLMTNGAIAPGGTLFWDEPETNLNPKLQRVLVRALVDLAAAGVQIFIGTHSLFLMKELNIALAERRRPGAGQGDAGTTAGPVPARFFSFVLKDGAVEVERGDTLEDLSTIAALDAAIEQEDRAQAVYWDLDARTD